MRVINVRAAFQIVEPSSLRRVELLPVLMVRMLLPRLVERPKPNHAGSALITINASADRSGVAISC